MTARNITPPYPVFLDRDGTPLDNGFVFIGVENLEPVTNPLPVFWDEALTISADQPIRTINGYPSRAGTPSQLFSNSDYSISVRDSKNTVVYTELSSTNAATVFTQYGTGAVKRSMNDKAAEQFSVKDFGAVGDGVTDDGPAIQRAIDAAGANPSIAVVFPGTTTSYYIASGLRLDNAKGSLKADGVVVVSTDQSIDMLTVTGAASIIDGIQFYRTAGTGKGVVLSVPECKLYNLRISGGHSIGLEMNGAYLTSMIKCYISGNAVNVKDTGTSQASEMVGCNLYGGASTSTNLIWESASLTVMGGAIEFSNSWEVLLGITNDGSRAQFVGVHFESTPTTTNPMIVAGKPTSGNTQISLKGCEFFGNSATRTAMQLRGVSACESGGHYFSSFNAASTLYDITAVARNIIITPSNNTTAATYKTVNASVTGMVDFETESSNYNSASLTHGASGGTLAGIQDIKSSARGSALTITSKRNSAGNAMDFKTPGTDNATLFSRMQMTSGADVGKVTFPSATVEVPGSYTAPFKIGTAYFWMNAGKLYLKDGSLPASATDGTIVGTQT